ncbi:MAG: endolytic transglycosylase MltG [Cytophagaceae bacterium]
MKDRRYKLKVGIVIFGLLFVSFSFYAYQIFFTPNFKVEEGKPYVLYIPTGATFQTVADSLRNNERIMDFLSFAFISRLMDYQENVKPGRYEITSKNSSNVRVVRLLKSGKQSPLNLTFNNIRLKKDFAERISKKMEFSEKSLLQLLNNPEYTKHFGFDTTTIMSMFIPNTYEVFWTLSPEDFCERMYKEYNNFWTEERKQKAQALGLTQIQVSIMASIVEAETNKTHEMPTISGVYLNRLRADMPLQADPTVKFAVGDFSIKRIYSGHLETDSPYNTYKYTGLPPGPINLPSITALDAVLNTERHKYIYFCASENLNGTHNFAENFEEHKKNAEKYRKALNKLKIK